VKKKYEKKQRTLKEKTELLKELGLGEELSSAASLIEDKSIRETIERHDDRCSYNACPLNFCPLVLTKKVSYYSSEPIYLEIHLGIVLLIDRQEK